MPSLLDAPVVFVDVETTGGHAARDRITEIGLVVATGSGLEYEWSTLVNPGMSIPPSIQHFTGITDEMVRDAPFFEDVAEELFERLEGRLFVAHNARFDYGFIRAEFKRAGRKFASRLACTVRLSRRMFPDMPRHNLDAVIERHGLKCEQRHRALPDAQALWQFWGVLQEAGTRAHAEEALLAITQLGSLPSHLPASLPDELPEGSGVYRFYGENDALLYVGKANNIRQRVLSHWQGAARDTKSQRLAELTRRIEWTETAGELGALLLEARLVRERRPLYNRQLRGTKQIWTWVIADDGASPELSPLDQQQLSFEASDAFGLFPSAAAGRKALVEAARENNLCLKVLGLEKTLGSCFAHQIERCAGACMGNEPLRLHAVRLKMAFASLRLREWPFKGWIGIRETSPSGLQQLHVIDDWRHVGTMEEGDELPSRRRTQPLDIDVYKILVRYLLGAKRMQVVKLPVASEQDVA